MGRIRIVTLSMSGMIAAALSPGATYAADSAHFMNVPATDTRLRPNFAVQVELKLRLPQGKGLARQLLDAGVDQADAAAAARLAAGHLGDATDGCDVTVSMSRDMQSEGFALRRLLIVARSYQTVSERGDGELHVGTTSPELTVPRLS